MQEVEAEIEIFHMVFRVGLLEKVIFKGRLEDGLY